MLDRYAYFYFLTHHYMVQLIWTYQFVFKGPVQFSHVPYLEMLELQKMDTIGHSTLL